MFIDELAKPGLKTFCNKKLKVMILQPICVYYPFIMLKEDWCDSCRLAHFFSLRQDGIFIKYSHPPPPLLVNWKSEYKSAVVKHYYGQNLHPKLCDLQIILHVEKLTNKQKKTLWHAFQFSKDFCFGIFPRCKYHRNV